VTLFRAVYGSWRGIHLVLEKRFARYHPAWDRAGLVGTGALQGGFP